MLAAARAPLATKVQVEMRAVDSASFRSSTPRGSQPVASQWPLAFDSSFWDLAESANADPRPSPTRLPAASTRLARLSVTDESRSAVSAGGGAAVLGLSL